MTPASARAVIRSVTPAGISLDDVGTLDGNPDRVDFSVELIEGDPEHFCDWLLSVETYVVRYGTEPGKVLRFTALGPVTLPLEEGRILGPDIEEATDE